jgi:hypothetical protein
MYAAEISLLASRKAGEILSQLEKSDGGRPKRETHVRMSRVSRYRRTLQETNTSVRTAQQWQELAKVPHATVRDTKNIESPRGATGRVTDETDYFRIADKSEIERKQLSGSAQVLP